jgi:hypothetical protein
VAPVDQIGRPMPVPDPAVDHDAGAALALEVAHQHVAEAAGVRAAVRLHDEHVAGLDLLQHVPQGRVPLDVLLAEAGGDVLALRHELQRADPAGDLLPRRDGTRPLDEGPPDALRVQLGAGGGRADPGQPLHEGGIGRGGQFPAYRQIPDGVVHVTPQ